MNNNFKYFLVFWSFHNPIIIKLDFGKVMHCHFFDRLIGNN